jgi:phosphatidylserine/phosphatidylglycerophosphate/cardiolipin synthase-like enzyme
VTVSELVVDGRWTLLTSANFTEAAQERNLEAGVVVPAG